MKIRCWRSWFLICLFVQCGYTAATAMAAPAPDLIVYTYDSFMAEGGLGREIFPLFEKKCGCRVRALASGEVGQMMTRLQLDAERGKPMAHVVIGVDQHLWDRAKQWLEPWGKWSPNGYDRLVSGVRVGKTGEGFLPLDYGIFALIADMKALKKSGRPLPTKLSSLLDPQWKRNIILEDPRTSTPGLAFLLYTREILGERAWAFWKGFKSQWLTLTPGWSQAYGIFMKNEAPLVWSYTTSQAYHQEHGDTEGRYRAVLFDEGQPLQIEGAALVKGTLDAPGVRDRAKAFLEFLLSPQVQKLIPRRNWMLPVVRGTELPPSFVKLPKPKRILGIPSTASLVSDSLVKWSRTIE